TRLPATLAALEAGRTTLAKARIIDAETLNLSDEHTAAVEAQVLIKARQRTPGQVRVATRRAVLSVDPAAAGNALSRPGVSGGVRMWPEPDGMATLSAYLPAADAVGVFAVLDEHARHAGSASDERNIDARRSDALVDLVLDPTAVSSAASSTTRNRTTEEPGGPHSADGSASHATGRGSDSDDVAAPAATGSASCRCECGRCRRGGGVDGLHRVAGYR
ncbi:MAG: DUF222 domain-containing protein, partial [Pseudonocardiaceae bacterium]